MTDFDQREELLRHLDLEERLSRISKGYTEYTMHNVINMRVNASCTHCEAIEYLVEFCLKNKDKWGDSEDSFRQMSWAVDKAKEFLGNARDTFAGTEQVEEPSVISVEWSGTSSET